MRVHNVISCRCRIGIDGYDFIGQRVSKITKVEFDFEAAELHAFQFYIVGKDAEYSVLPVIVDLTKLTGQSRHVPQHVRRCGDRGSLHVRE